MPFGVPALLRMADEDDTYGCGSVFKTGFNALAVAETECPRGVLATPVSRTLLRLVAIGCDGNPLRRRPRNESLNTARVDRRHDVDFLCFNLSTKRAGTGRGVLNPLK